jgi:hypothetical protein
MSAVKVPPAPPSLHRYLPYKKEFIRQAIVERRLKFSNPENFNDPWDCRPNYAPLELYNKDQIREARARVKDTFLRNHNVFGGKKNARNQIVTNEYLDRTIRSMTSGMENFIFSERRILCLSEEKDNILLWSHYADDHSGVCLEFSTNSRTFAAAFPVAYHQDWPEIYIGRDPKELRSTVFFQKADRWAYEREHRIIAVEEQFLTPEERTHVASGGVIPSKDGIVVYSENALSSVTVGCRANEDVVSDVLEMIRDSGKPIKLRKAVRSSRSYALEFQDLGA